jgi:histidinol-phosphate aminotransferase
LTQTIIKLAQRLAAGECSSRELVDDALKRITTHAELNAFITIDEEAARASAQAADAALRARGLIVRPVASYGLPQCLRLTIGSAEECALLASVLAEFMVSVHG